MPQSRKIIVIGGGASGMIAAIVAARLGAQVIIIERMSRIGKKLLATGNGRCNLSNSNPDIRYYHGASPTFAVSVLRQFGVAETVSFFEELGLVLRTEEDGKIFPITDQASSVLDVLRLAMEELGIEVVCDANVQKVEKAGNGFHCSCSNGLELTGDRVIVATGGKSSPNLGSNGVGFKLAEALGHRIETPFPALVQVRLDEPFLKQLAGIRVQAAAEILIDGHPSDSTSRREHGEILFTDYGLSGIPILHLSRIVSEFQIQHREELKKIKVRIDLFPQLAKGDLEALIHRRMADHPGRPVEVSLIGLIHKRLIPVILKHAGIADIHLACGALSQKEIERIASTLKGWPLHCNGTQSWMTSQVTAGGVDVRQIERQTMGSQITPGIYFAGEVLDIDGDCGGYNLQWAWSSGYVAGMSAAK